MKHLVIIISTAILLASCSVFCRQQIKLKNTTWVCETKVFVADAGYETVTRTLKFISAKKFVLETSVFMPPYPNMYMNSDGTVDTNPGYSSQFVYEGTYSFENGVVTLRNEVGTEDYLYLRDGNLVNDLPYEPEVFIRQ